MSNPPSSPSLSVVVTCMGRLHHIKLSAPPLLAQEGVEYILVDYSCPDRCGDYARVHWPTAKVVEVPGQQYFNLSRARNAGAGAATAPWLAFLDADRVVAPNFAAVVLAMIADNVILGDHDQSNGVAQSIFSQAAFAQTGGYDERLQGWGCEDADMRCRLLDLGLKLVRLPPGIMQMLDHEEAERVHYYEEKDKLASARANGARVVRRLDPERRLTWPDPVTFGITGCIFAEVWKSVQFVHFVRRTHGVRVRLYACWHGWPGRNFSETPLAEAAALASEIAAVLDAPVDFDIVTDAPLEQVQCLVGRWPFDYLDYTLVERQPRLDIGPNPLWHGFRRVGFLETSPGTREPFIYVPDAGPGIFIHTPRRRFAGTSGK